MSESVRVRVKIVGRVQGVGYRYSAYYKAESLGLVGWVRNAPDGSVESLVEGQGAAVDAFVAWCRKGPSMARVTEVRVDRGEPTGEFARFDIRY